MRVRRALAVAGVAVGVAVGSIAVAGPANASWSGCTNSGFYRTCISVNGTGLYVRSMTASLTYLNSNVGVTSFPDQICLHSDPTNSAIVCSSFEFLLYNQPISVTWSPNGDVLAGGYCANSWTAVPQHVLISSICANVHP
jgi:hypothetical protein